MWDSLPKDVLEELNDAKYLNRTHGKKATAGQGCHGPLCQKAERDAAREKTRKRAVSEGRPYKPQAPGPERARDEELDRIIAWHESNRGRAIQHQRHCASCACQALQEVPA